MNAIIQSDEQARRDALNPTQSFIVQAPAGSGKTELLTQRYLSLLNHACDAPEEIIAITFTRKAAAEMRDRILSALHRPQDGPLAKNVLENPQRLRILTIDALCGQLSNRLPLLAGYGAPARIVENAIPYYQQAVREIMLQATPLELLAHLDNNAEKLLQLCVELLAQREQWLPYLVGGDASSPQLRRHLEQGLEQLAQEILETAQKRLGPDLRSELLPLLRFAGKNLLTKQTSHPLTLWADRNHFPSPEASQLEIWRGLAQALLTAKGEWRKMIDIRTGFPPKTAEKIAFEEILARLADDDRTCTRLRQILQCPPTRYEDGQWQIINILIQVLPLLAAQLQLIFQQHGVMDFIELGLSASRALGEEQQPTDLALSLDYRIRHLLVDEFQDTSVAQFKLLEKLLLGWEPGDGRTVFLVGDPMQSIYRFRNAEVSLFLRAMHRGVQQIPLTALTLTRNFRSGENLIAWFNAVFPQILPAIADLTSGAIPYTAATATQSQIFSPAVSCYGCNNAVDEARQIVNIIEECRQKNTAAKIAVLVRSRPHLFKIIPALQAAQIKFQAVEIEPLAERSEIQDLAALTRALHHRGDRIAWLAVLRAPYCGLTLADLHTVAQAAQRRTIYEALLDFSQLSLSEDGQKRLRRIVPALSQALCNRGRLPLTAWVEGAWMALGGPAGLDHPHELLNTQAYFRLLMALEQEQQIPDAALLTQRLQKLYAAADAQSDASLQIMTIHKAKGLEFDHVILPELQRKPTADSSKLLLWLERPQSRGGSHLILAPIKEAAADSDPMYVYLKQIEQQKLLYESGRLLYVAATRARQTLHLLAVLPEVPQIKEWQPPMGSFLQMLWPYFREQIPDGDTVIASVSEAIQYGVSTEFELDCFARARNDGTLCARLFQRLVADWQPPPLPNKEPPAVEIAVFSTAMHPVVPVHDKQSAWTGTVIHEALAELAQRSPHFSDVLTNTRWERRLRQLGILAADLPKAMTQIHGALQKTLADPRGLWILSASHQEPKNEYALSAVIDQQVQHVILDRTFIDEAGIRWIIDYKTGIFTEGDIDFYYPQLERYARIMALRDPRPIRLGLYFPVCSTWREWDWHDK
jgi:ATP-dependent helicase/nuclease subunit A